MTKTEQKIRELVPSLTELTFGAKYRYKCTGEVEYWYGTRFDRKKAKEEYAKKSVFIAPKEFEWYERVYTGQDFDTYMLKDWNGRKAKVDRWGNGKIKVRYLDFEVIGIPIQLHHVLQAISGDGKLADEGVVINAGGDMVVLKNENGDVTTTSEIVTWDLTKNFHDQTAEVQMFISHLLE